MALYLGAFSSSSPAITNIKGLGQTSMFAFYLLVLFMYYFICRVILLAQEVVATGMRNPRKLLNSSSMQQHPNVSNSLNSFILCVLAFSK